MLQIDYKCPHCKKTIKVDRSTKFCPNCAESLNQEEINKLVTNGEKWQKVSDKAGNAGNAMQNTGKAMSGCGCLLTIFITIPIIIILFLLLF